MLRNILNMVATSLCSRLLCGEALVSFGDLVCLAPLDVVCSLVCVLPARDRYA